MSELKVTSLADLQTYAQGQVIQLPEFDDGMPFVARLKRASMMFLMKSGKIPNKLLATAQSLFANDKNISNVEADNLSDMLSVVDIVVESCLVEPTLAEIRTAGLELTDTQKIAIFNYSQNGIKALEPFCSK